MKLSKWVVCLVCVVSLRAAAAVASAATPAAVAFDTFGPADTYANSGTWLGRDVDPTVNFFAAQAFRPSVGGKLLSIRASMYRVPGAIDQVTLRIIGQAPDGTPAPAIEYWKQTFTGVLDTWETPNPTALFDVADGPVLAAGTRYWLYVETPVVGERPYRWYNGLTGNGESTAFRTIRNTVPPSDTWTVFNLGGAPGRAMRVTVAVPEPAAAAPLTTAALAALVRRPRARRAR